MMNYELLEWFILNYPMLALVAGVLAIFGIFLFMGLLNYLWELLMWKITQVFDND